MADKLRTGVLTSFTGGELTPQLAGRVDKEEMKIGSRFVSNFLPEHQGGLKKFYGSNHVSTVTDALTNGYKLIPFDGCGEPLCLLFVSGKTYCVTRNEKYEVSINLPLQMVLGCSYVQSSDVMYITNESMGQAVITYTGVSEETGHHTFMSSSQNFVVEPFFPLNWEGNYNNLPLTTSASVGQNITITGQAVPTVYSIELPDALKGCGTGKNVCDEDDASLAILHKLGVGTNDTGVVTTGTCHLELHRVHEGTDSIIGQANIGVVVEPTETTNTVAAGA